MKVTKLLIFAGFILAYVNGIAQTAYPYTPPSQGPALRCDKPFELIWHDEFNGAELDWDTWERGRPAPFQTSLLPDCESGNLNTIFSKDNVQGSATYKKNGIPANRKNPVFYPSKKRVSNRNA